MPPLSLALALALILVGDLRAALVAAPEMPPSWDGGATTLVRYDSAILEPGGTVTHRWYRQVRAESQGDFGDPLGLVFVGQDQEVQVRLARLVRGAKELPVPHRFESTESREFSRGERKLRLLPGEVRPGDVLEVLLERTVQSTLGGLDFAPAHSFGGSSPVGRDLFEVRVPRGTALRYLARGLGAGSRPETGQEGDQDYYRWVVGPLPSSTRRSGKRPYVRTTRLDSWRQVADWYRPRLRSRMVVSPAIRERGEALVRGLGTARERLASLLSFVTWELPYHHQIEGSESDLCGRSAELVLRQRKGNCADKSNLLSALLTSQGIPAHPVLTADVRRWPVDPEVPGFLPGDHALVRVDLEDGPLFLDPTEPGYMPGVLPPRLRKVVVWDPFTGEFLATPGGSQGQDLLDRRFEGILQPEGSLLGWLSIRAEGEPAAQIRRVLAHPRGGEKLTSLLLPPGVNIRQRRISPIRDLGAPLSLEFQMEQRLPAMPGGRILLRPPFAPPARRTETDAGKDPGRMEEMRVLETARIELPPSLEAKALGRGENLSGTTSSLRAGWSQPRDSLLEYHSDYRRRGPEPDAEVLEARKSQAARVVVLQSLQLASTRRQP